MRPVNPRRNAASVSLRGETDLLELQQSRQKLTGERASAIHDPTQPVAIGADHLVSEPSGTRTSQAVYASADRAGGNSPAASAGQAATVLALCLLLSMSASISMKRGAVITQGKPRNNSLVENVGEK